jgi:hypothetical protein
MINNIDIISPLLQFNSGDDFYHLQILKRKKEHPTLGSNSYVVKTYYVSSLEYLSHRYPEIKALCEFHNARAYINLNVRSYERLAFQMLKKVIDQIMNKDFKSVRKAYESVAGEFGTGKDKRWIIDIDFADHVTEDYVKTLKAYIESEFPESGGILAEVPTKNGFHLITKPFRLDSFMARYLDIDVHKNNPTILYIP